MRVFNPGDIVYCTRMGATRMGASSGPKEGELGIVRTAHMTLGGVGVLWLGCNQYINYNAEQAEVALVVHSGPGDNPDALRAVIEDLALRLSRAMAHLHTVQSKLDLISARIGKAKEMLG